MHPRRCRCGPAPRCLSCGSPRCLGQRNNGACHMNMDPLVRRPFKGASNASSYGLRRSVCSNCATRRARPLTSLPNPISSFRGGNRFQSESPVQIATTIMATPPTSRIPKKNVRIDCGKYLIRTIKKNDASDRWASWMSDPEVMYSINVRARRWTKSDVAEYIGEFDQRSNLLLGIFEKQDWTHIGIYTIQADYNLSRGLVNLLIGEPAYRNRGVLTAVRRGFAGYFFETLGLETMMATALSRNRVIIDTLLKAGWILDQTLKQHVKSHADGSMLDLCRLHLARDTLRARNY
jgi:RimJ/RimL family protein N-acetyltransferase